MGRRSRKRAHPRVAPSAGGSGPAKAGSEPTDGDRTRGRGGSRYARSRERDAEVRAQLEPLGTGERPTAVTVAAIVAAVLAIANVVAVFVGADVGSSAASFTVVSTGLLVAASAGMWYARYWAVLGFQVILAFQILILAIAVVRVEKWWVGLIVLVLIGLGGLLFWKLVKAMARIQMPHRNA